MNLSQSQKQLVILALNQYKRELSHKVSHRIATQMKIDTQEIISSQNMIDELIEIFK